jgi:hypothetical protein
MSAMARPLFAHRLNGSAGSANPAESSCSGKDGHAEVV